jgi:hypothetical protein
MSADNRGFTPGPWHVRSSGSVGTDDKLVSIAYGDDEECHPDDRMIANARLIAAAPDLLEALIGLHNDVMDYINLNNLGGENNTWLVIARAAIARAAIRKATEEA